MTWTMKKRKRMFNTDGDKQRLQNDLDKLVKQSEKWQMFLSFGKCKCLHTGHGNWDVNYNMGNTMKVSEQCGIATSKGNQILDY